MPVLDIRGTHGSGKSYIIHNILKGHETKELHQLVKLRSKSTRTTKPHYESPTKPGEYKRRRELIGYEIEELNATVIGPYKSICGGCDQVKTADEVERRIRLFAGVRPNVLLEGILVAHTFQRYSRIAHDLQATRYIFLFLDTPLEVCIQRVTDRRLARGNRKPLDPSNVIKDYHRIWERLRQQCLDAGHEVAIINHKGNVVSQVLSHLE